MIRAFALAVATLGLFPNVATAGEVCSWTTPDGVLEFTDDPKRIPVRYRQEAHCRPMPTLADYHRFTPIEQGTPDDERVRGTGD